MRIVDLSVSLQEGMFSIPVHWHPCFEMSIVGRHAVEGRASRRITFGTHTGTHVDAPLHFLPEGRSVDQLDLHRLVGPARLLDVPTPERQPISRESLAKLAPFGAERVIVRTGWLENRWGKPGYSDGRPYLTPDVAQFLVSEGVRLFGIDTSDIESPAAFIMGKPSELHSFFFEHDVILIENVANLGAIGADRFTLVALPLRIVGADGSPARVIALVP